MKIQFWLMNIGHEIKFVRGYSNLKYIENCNRKFLTNTSKLIETNWLIRLWSDSFRKLIHKNHEKSLEKFVSIGDE